MAKKYGELVKYDIVMQGVMTKSPPQKSKSFFKIIAKRWRSRHFVLYKTYRPSQVHLLYFRAEPTQDSKSIGSINLVKLTNLTADVGNKVNRSNVFSIQTTDKNGADRIYYLCASSYELMNIWVDKIVLSLNVNPSNSRINSVQTLPWSTNNNTMRVMPLGTPNYTSNPKISSTMSAIDISPEDGRFSFSTLGERYSSNGSSSYYNMSPAKSPLRHEAFVEPLVIEEEDIYKYPYEMSSIHNYENFGDGIDSSITTKNNSLKHMYFPNDYSSFNFINDTKSADVNCDQEYIFPNDDLPLECRKLSLYHPSAKFPEKSRSLEDGSSFEFQLPTRLQSGSISDSESSSGSSSDDEDINSPVLAEADSESQAVSQTPFINPNPPPIPRRINLSENSQVFTPTDTVSSIKTPKSDSSFHFTSFNNESQCSLNYMDAGNLLLGNHCVAKPVFFHDSLYCNHGEQSNNISDTINVDCATPVTCCTAENNISSVFGNEVPTSIEYRNICEARTEALVKLNDRILNNE